jgi:hypothetical protein
MFVARNNEAPLLPNVLEKYGQELATFQIGQSYGNANLPSILDRAVAECSNAPPD